ncbi:YciI family protein [Massilia sp. YIM B02763]|uniref:YciI family protein n=1 Tax=Massilia sp. YIM B02763 TaxID=3050130 RepID=UPI0025B67AA1|nr:YciI family protein [Massilia sp. YIM B02763]MDN4054552.1 YciI family protein [Massilia sp. YIM B02763]
MKFIVFAKASAASEAGVMPSEQLIADMGRFNEELAMAGVLLAADGMHPSSKGARILYDGDKRTVVDGPFTETRELVAGYWIIEVGSLQEAIEWMKKAPSPQEGTVGEVEIRQIFGEEDFGEAMTRQLREQEDRVRAHLAAR